MYNKLMKLADKLDNAGHPQVANMIDNLVKSAVEETFEDDGFVPIPLVPEADTAKEEVESFEGDDVDFNSNPTKIDQAPDLVVKPRNKAPATPEQMEALELISGFRDVFAAAPDPANWTPQIKMTIQDMITALQPYLNQQ